MRFNYKYFIFSVIFCVAFNGLLMLLLAYAEVTNDPLNTFAIAAGTSIIMSGLLSLEHKGK